MHEDYILVTEIILCTVNGINIICLVINRIIYKSNIQRQIKRITILHKYCIIVACSHDYFCYSHCLYKSQLTAEDSICGRYLSHTFGMLTSENSHTAAKTGIQNQCFHMLISLLFDPSQKAQIAIIILKLLQPFPLHL